MQVETVLYCILKYSSTGGYYYYYITSYFNQTWNALTKFSETLKHKIMQKPV